MSEDTATKTFCGLPIGVSMEPIEIQKHKPNKNKLLETLNLLAKIIAIGVAITAIVSLVNNALAKAADIRNKAKINFGLLDFKKNFRQKEDNIPEEAKASPKLNAPNKKSTTSHFIANNACVGVIWAVASIKIAPMVKICHMAILNGNWCLRATEKNIVPNIIKLIGI